MNIEVHFCAQCGFRMEGYYEFCPNCGARVEYDEQTINIYDNQSHGNPYMQQGMQMKKSNRSIIIVISIIGILLLIILGYFLLKDILFSKQGGHGETENTPKNTTISTPENTPTNTPKNPVTVSDAELDGMWKGTMKPIEVKKDDKPIAANTNNITILYLKLIPGEKGEGSLAFGLGEEPGGSYHPYTYSNGKLVCEAEGGGMNLVIIANFTRNNDTLLLKGNFILNSVNEDGSKGYVNWQIETVKQ